jgi:3-hydroxybutyryl-CoA dehydrogenase
MEIKKVGVIGCGLMGSGIVETAAKAGFPVVVREVSEELLKKGRTRIENSISRAVEKGKATPAEKEAALARITNSTKLADLSDCDIVIEAVIENMEEKKKLFKELDGIVKPSALFASNTSSLPITDMSAVTKRGANFVGLHFFNPVPVMKLVEVVKTVITAEETFKTAKTFAEKLGKTVVVAKDTPGFVVNLLFVPYLLDAVRAYEKGVATREDIDNGMKLGCGHPMGPLELLDFVGIDTTYYIAEIMFDEFKDDHYAAPPLMRRLVAAGFWGKKTGRGIYEYDEKGNKK